ncbi:(2Fe-2S)-binding protein [Pseudonocardia ailaonensis]|uniref:(2Fe-2S)-binding protein n=1 Tax=Pseudonocardia ailaonensis TaxID=367279 RepID=A0ABN2ND59_9PSEU
MTMTHVDPAPHRTVSCTVNGKDVQVRCRDGALLVEMIRDTLDLTGTHIGCLNGDCGVCTVRVDGQVTKSCLYLAARAEGAEVTTIEGVAEEGTLHEVQQALWNGEGFQCGFCVPGQVFCAMDLLESNTTPSDGQIRHAISGNLCRCTGYQKIVEAIHDASTRLDPTEKTATH